MIKNDIIKSDKEFNIMHIDEQKQNTDIQYTELLCKFTMVH